MSNTNSDRIHREILPEHYYAMYLPDTVDNQVTRRGGFKLLRMLWFGAKD